MRFLTAVLVCLMVLLLASTRDVVAVEYYVAPSGGSDSNNGAIGSPFATFGKAIGLATAGDTIFARGGTYNLSSKLQITKAGATNNPIKLFAYPGETPILDFTNQADADSNRGLELTSSADWWHIKGLTIQKAGDNGFNSSGDHGVFEQMVTRNNRDSGFQFGSSASFNLSLNCDSYGNYDPQKRGEDADGFAVKSVSIGAGNIFMGNRAWDNSDDGWDMFGSRANGVLIMNSWAFDNGLDPGGSGAFLGDGNGIKLGHDSGSHILAGVLAVSNPEHGIDINGNGYIYEGNNPISPNGSLVKIYNSASLDNGNRNFFFDEALPHTLRNNISLNGDESDDFEPEVVDDHNTWNGSAFAASAEDFVSLDLGDGMAQAIAQVLRGPRQTDGGLPDLGGFLKLKAGSNLIDAGVTVSFIFGGVTYNLPYLGTAPDLGPIEFSAAPVLPGDYNGDDIVDVSDYTVWRDALGTSTSLPNDETPGFVDQDDYGVWKTHFGELLEGRGGQATTAVPEPTAILLMLLAAAGIGAVVFRRKRPSTLAF